MSEYTFMTDFLFNILPFVLLLSQFPAQ
jgi:hypothetical protein